MTRNELIDAVADLPGAQPEQLYYIDSLDDRDLANHDCFCQEHAMLVAHAESIMCGVGAYVAAQWSPDDRAERCDWYGCDKPLDGGGLTDYGVDSALGLTEEDPLACHVYPAELVLAASAMQHDDPRWATWEAHARRLIAERRKR